MKFVNLEGGMYRTQVPLGKRIEASMILRQIDERLRKLINHLNAKYMIDIKNPLNVHAPLIANLLEDYNSKSIQETHPLEDGETSYVLTDGKILSLCIRHTDGSIYVFHDINTLTFVGLHEITHIATASSAHSDKFWRVFKWLLIEAVTIGIYKPIDYKKYPVMYCDKINITYSPLYDDTLGDFF